MEIIMKKLLAFVLAIVLMVILPACGERVQGNSSVCTDSTTETCDATTKYLRMEDAAECVVRAVVVSTEMATPFEQTATLDVIKVYKGETADRIKLYQSSDSPLCLPMPCILTTRTVRPIARSICSTGLCWC